MNEYQSRIKSVTRKLMACVSELSMYQATGMKLEQERVAKEKQRKLALQKKEEQAKLAQQ